MAALNFKVDRFFAWAPGIETQEDWQCYFTDPENFVIADDHKANVAFIPAMKRRRLSVLARAAFYAADKCLEPGEQPSTIFSSMYGESQRTYDILSDIVAREDLSPMAFSLSVHNAISGQFSILQGLKSPTIAVAPGKESYLGGFADAIGQLLEGTDQVLLVFYEEAVPEFYQQYIRTSPYPVALAVKISLNNHDDMALTLSYDGNSMHESETEIPLMNMIRFFSGLTSECSLGPWKLSN
ncbi:Uncharacterised protein [BD1-7 clade bacterium]|uniref:Beta-ketoacyl synthase-like N-terminal domain-containing protein n=1 Tax=BD1-7 clade bacterium TaxID=2029982 RepID=A0A5S9QMU0_9GAMM|nr:Uncharacterised protein [BD1-7 clade bacterium]CAA0119165.1 Uncharacterised protein [BD1-7 clade bacterium]